MASKSSFYVKRLNKTVDGYRVNEQLGLYLDDEDKLWRGCHLPTGQDLIGRDGRWKKKRSCLSFVESFVDFDWQVETEEELYEQNGGFEAVKDFYLAAVSRAEGLE
jgi:hypothetical protein